jgi:teichuronic acid biosynthesis glycosyltransferase TuaG
MSDESKRDDAVAPVVSVIIPTFNSAATIEQTIESVLSQSFIELEVIVCDDGSSDDTADLVDSIRQRDPRVIFSPAEKNFGGPAVPRNRGIALSRGEWIAFLDSDDLWMQHKLELQLKVAAEFSADFIVAGIEDFSGTLKSDELIHRPSIGGWVPVVEKLEYQKLLMNNIIPTSTTLVKSKLLRDNGLLFKEDKRYVAVEDYELWLRILSLPASTALKIREPFVFYRKADTSISKNKLHMFMKVKRVLRGELKNHSVIVRHILLTFYLLQYFFRSIYFRLVRRRL